MLKRSLALMALVFLACSCRTGIEIPGAPSPDVSQLEERVYDTAPDGERILVVKPAIDSRDDLLRYREMKVAEVAEILEITEEASADKPYYPAVITFARPISIAEFNDLISDHNPSVKALVSKAGFSKSQNLAKAELVKGVDKIVADVVRFDSTVGHGQLFYETMTDGAQLGRLEAGIAEREARLNGRDDFKLIEGIRNFRGGVHRDAVMRLFDDSRVFLADLGPIDIYDEAVTYAYWDDVSDLVERYLDE